MAPAPAHDPALRSPQLVPPRGSVHQTRSAAPAPRCDGCLQVTLDSSFKTHKLVDLLISLGVFIGSREAAWCSPEPPLPRAQEPAVVLFC